MPNTKRSDACDSNAKCMLLKCQIPSAKCQRPKAKCMSLKGQSQRPKSKHQTPHAKCKMPTNFNEQAKPDSTPPPQFNCATHPDADHTKFCNKPPANSKSLIFFCQSRQSMACMLSVILLPIFCATGVSVVISGATLLDLTSLHFTRGVL